MTDFARDEIVRTARTSSFDDLVPLTGITSKEILEELQACGYGTAITLSEFKEAFPEVDPTHIYYNNNFLDSSSYYWDKENLIVFPLHIFGTQFMSPNGKTLAACINDAVKYQMSQDRTAKDFVLTLHMSLNDRMRIQFLRFMAERNVPDLYDTFCDVYRISDYGCAEIGVDGMNQIMARKTEAQKAATEKSIHSFPEEVVVYRGVGDKSEGLDRAFSWTTSINWANIFATWRTERGAVIYKGKVKRGDILEFFKGEQELLIEPGKVYDIEAMPLYDMDWLESDAPRAAKKDFTYYKTEVANYKKIPFQLPDSAIHTQAHSARVLFHCMALAHLYHLPKEDRESLAIAALYHDTGRLHDEVDAKHGIASSKLYKRGVKKPDPVAIFLMKYHCKPDEQGYAFIHEDPLLSKDPDRYTMLFNIFKDADGLERLRLSPHSLDINQLRTEEAKKMTLIAKIAIRNIRE